MKLKFQADADLNPRIGRGLLRLEPSIDFRAAAGVIADGTPDLEVLRIAAAAGRVLVSCDLKTMGGHFERFVARSDSPGLLLIPRFKPMGASIEGLLFAWLEWTAEEMQNQIRWLP